MRVDIATDAFELHRAQLVRLASDCREWVLRARVLHANHLVQGEIQRVEMVAQRFDQLAGGLANLADAYRDNEAAGQRAFEPLALAMIVLASVPALPVVVPALAGLGLVQATSSQAVSVRATTAVASTPVGSVEELLSRIPQADAQVRIDTLHSSGRTHYVIYISGTRDWSPVPTGQPWDFTSDVGAMTGADVSACEAAVRAAMTDAGIARGAHVVLVGHSLGGLVAARLAASNDFSVSDIVTAGAPIHKIAVPESTRVTSFEFNNDVIPALSGAALAGSAIVVRSSFVKEGALDDQSHALSSYRQEARAFDQSTDVIARRRKQTVLAATHAESVTTQLFVAARN